MAAVRGRRSLDEADPFLPPGPGAHLRSGAEMAALFARYPTAVPTAAAIGEECSFDLHLVAPNLPPYDVPPGHDENSHLRAAHHGRRRPPLRIAGGAAGRLRSRSRRN